MTMVISSVFTLLRRTDICSHWSFVEEEEFSGNFWMAFSPKTEVRRVSFSQVKMFQCSFLPPRAGRLERKELPLLSGINSSSRL